MRTITLFLSLLTLPALAQNRPAALVLEHEDQWTHSAHAAELLEHAGFDVAPLPLDRSPADARADLILIGSFASEAAGHDAFMAAHADDLAAWVSGGGTLVQLTQADQHEAAPPFLPDGLEATRTDADTAAVIVTSPDHPLLAGIAGPDTDRIAFSGKRTAWEAFGEQAGFEVILAADTDRRQPALMEAAHGRGRMILAAMALDKASMGDQGGRTDADALDAFRTHLFANLAGHVASVRAGEAREPKPTPSALEARRFHPDSWTLAILPDTQIYSVRFPGMFFAQTGWLAKNAERLNIPIVLHLGDIVHNNTHAEWQHASDAMSLLQGAVPYALAPGNHDYGPRGSASTRDTLLNEYFDFETHAAMPTFGGAMEEGSLDNAYHLFEAGGEEWIVIALEWGPRDETIRWANEVMAEHPDRKGILITHAYMNNNDLRYDHTDEVNPQRYNPHHYDTPGGVNDGEELWQKLVRNHDFRLVFNGHVLGDGTGYLASRNDAGNFCHQMLSNYQMRELGGEGYMRLLEFRPDGTVRVKSYSPVYDDYMLEPDQYFEFQLETPAETMPAR